MAADQWLGWVAAAGLAVERAWKVWTDRQALRKDIRALGISEGESLFRRATEMMDRLEKENAELRARIEHLEDELETEKSVREEEMQTYRAALAARGITLAGTA